MLPKCLNQIMFGFTLFKIPSLTCGPIGYPGWDCPSWLCSEGLLLVSDWTEPSRAPERATGRREEKKKRQRRDHLRQRRQCKQINTQHRLPRCDITNAVSHGTEEGSWKKGNLYLSALSITAVAVNKLPTSGEAHWLGMMHTGGSPMA